MTEPVYGLLQKEEHHVHSVRLSFLDLRMSSVEVLLSVDALPLGSHCVLVLVNVVRQVHWLGQCS